MLRPATPVAARDGRWRSHSYLGRRYRLLTVVAKGAAAVTLRNGRLLELHAAKNVHGARRELLVQRWYRERLRELVPPLLDKWQAKLGVELTAWGIKRMKTRWGTCNTEARRVWLNLELAKKPPQCLEYVVVHELVHLIVRTHDRRFHALMDRHLPRWKHIRRVLNAAPLAREDWGC